MPDLQPPAPPQAQPQAAPGQPPFGSSPAVGPTANRGQEAAGLQKVGLIIKMMEDTVPLLGAATEPGRDLLKALTLLSKHIPAGTVSPAAQQNTMQSMMLKQAQMGPQIAAMRAAAAQGAHPGV